jgi:phosphoribosylformylglycinamidine cyclo-ligase
LAQNPADIDKIFGGQRLVDLLLEPTRIYVQALLKLFQLQRPKALAHITGGGLTENIPRVLPNSLAAHLRKAAWPEPPVFDWLRSTGIAENEMHRTFNCGIGMTVIVAPEIAAKATEVLNESGERAWIIGEIDAAADERQVIIQ